VTTNVKNDEAPIVRTAGLLMLSVSLLSLAIFTRVAHAASSGKTENLLPCAYFYSQATGFVQLLEFGTNQSDAINPIGPITRVHLSLVSTTNEIPFVRLANHKQSISLGFLSEARAPASFRIRNAHVIGYSPLLRSTQPSVELGVASWTTLKPDAIRFPKHRDIECLT
jgi:hypothetical protein